MSEPNDHGRPNRTRPTKAGQPRSTSRTAAPTNAKQELHQRLAAHARRLMVEGGYSSISAFANRVGLAHSYVHQVLKGERTPGLEFVAALHRGLGVDANELLDRDPPARWFQPLECRLIWEPAGDDG